MPAALDQGSQGRRQAGRDGRAVALGSNQVDNLEAWQVRKACRHVQMRRAAQHGGDTFVAW